MNENKLIKILISITAVLVLLNIVDELIGKPSWQITRLIGLDYESNFSTWFSSLLLAIAAFYAYKCSVVVKIKENGQKMWRLVALLLIFMSCDEVAMITTVRLS